jgi:hypothetical protein
MREWFTPDKGRTHRTIYRFALVANSEKNSMVLCDRWSTRTNSRDGTLVRMRTRKFDTIYWTGHSFQSSEWRIQGRNRLTKSNKLTDSSSSRKERGSDWAELFPFSGRIWASDRRVKLGWFVFHQCCQKKLWIWYSFALLVDRWNMRHLASVRFLQI